MNDFFKAALPWIAIGLSVAVAAANWTKHKKQDGDEGEQKPKGNHMLDGMCFGMCIGTALGSSGAFDLATGVSLGMLLGMVVGSCIKG